jgi:hypothetical protein
MSEDLQAKLDRISARVSQRKADARTLLLPHPHLLEFCELARAKFGAKLTWVQTPEGEIGKQPRTE